MTPRNSAESANLKYVQSSGFIFWRNVLVRTVVEAKLTAAISANALANKRFHPVFILGREKPKVIIYAQKRARPDQRRNLELSFSFRNIQANRIANTGCSCWIRTTIERFT